MNNDRVIKRKYRNLKKQYKDAIYNYSIIDAVYSERFAACKTIEDIERARKDYLEARNKLEERIKFLDNLITSDHQRKNLTAKTVGNIALGGVEAGIAVGTGVVSMLNDDQNEILHNKITSNSFRWIFGLIGKTKDQIQR